MISSVISPVIKEISHRVGIPRSSGRQYWTPLTLVVEDAAPTHVVITFPSAKTILASDFTIAGVTVVSGSWTNLVYTLVLSPAVNYGDVLNVVYKSKSYSVTNNVIDPLTIINDGNTVAWFKASDLTTITKDAGTGEVSRWNDRLGSGHDLKQAVATKYPIWSANGILFDKINDYMKCDAFTLNQPTYVYIIFNQKSYVNACYVFDGNTYGTGFLAQYPYNANLQMYAGKFGNTLVATPYNVQMLVKALFNGASSELQKNDESVVLGDAGMANMGGFILGVGGGVSAAYANIEVREILIRKVADSDFTKYKLSDYLSKPYSLYPRFNDSAEIFDGSVMNNSVLMGPIADQAGTVYPNTGVRNAFGTIKFTTDAPNIWLKANPTFYGIYSNYSYLRISIDGTLSYQQFSTSVYKYISLGAGTKTVEITESGIVLYPAVGEIGCGITSVKIPYGYTYSIVDTDTPANKMLFLGDSISVGGSATYMTNGYTMKFRDAGNNVSVYGVGGTGLFHYASTTDKINNTVSKINALMDGTSSNKLLIDLGFNDWHYTFSGHVAVFQTNYGLLLDAIHAARPDIVIKCISPIISTCLAGGEGANGDGDTLADFRTAVSNACTGRAYCTYIDGYSLMTAGGLDADGIHPTNTGHTTMYNSLVGLI
jgi:hypothetical protein